LAVASESFLGVAQTSPSTLTVNSGITGSSTLRVVAGGNGGSGAHTIRFGGDLSGFTGILDVGGGTNNAGALAGWALVLDFNQDYDLPAVGIVMGQRGTNDRLNLDQNIRLGSFTFGATSLPVGTYSAADLNQMFGNGTQFIDGGGTLTIGDVEDSDGDGLPDHFEDLIIGFDPSDAINGYEDVAGPNDPNPTDFDGDGLSDALEYASGTDPTAPDTDGDGLRDGPEVHGTNNAGVSHGFGPTHPRNVDTDGDGLEDGAEVAGTDNAGFAHGFGPTNPNAADSDLDGIKDGAEVDGTDNNGDGLPDPWEISYGLDPNSGVGLDGAGGDVDDDGLTNLQEFADHQTNPVNPDTDGDGLFDGAEVAGTGNNGVSHGFGATSPLLADSDSDGFNDLTEIVLGSDPNSAASLPGSAVNFINGGFEEPVVATSTVGIPVSGGTVPGWTVVKNDFYVIDRFSFGPDAATPTAAREGAQFASADRRAPEPDVDGTAFDGGIDATMSMRQDLDVSSLASGIDAGARSLWVDFDWFDNDSSDAGLVTLRFLDHTGKDLGRRVVFNTGGQAGQTWRAGRLAGYPPAGTRTVRILVEVVKTVADASTARNVAFDNFRARLLHLDADGDGIADDWEQRWGLDPANSADASESWDGDSLTNLQEFDFGTNPTLADTDGDGFDDDVEVAAGTDPLDAASVPGGGSDPRLIDLIVTKNGSGQVTRVELVFDGLNPAKTYVLKRSVDLISFPVAVQSLQPQGGSATFEDAAPPVGKAFYILDEQ
jgi:hypothetical protein